MSGAVAGRVRPGPIASAGWLGDDPELWLLGGGKADELLHAAGCVFIPPGVPPSEWRVASVSPLGGYTPRWCQLIAGVMVPHLEAQGRAELWAGEGMPESLQLTEFQCISLLKFARRDAWVVAQLQTLLALGTPLDALKYLVERGAEWHP